MKESRIVRVVTGGPASQFRRSKLAVSTLVKDSGLTAEFTDRGTAAHSLEKCLELLNAGAADCVLAQGGLFTGDSDAGVCLAAVLPREPAHQCLLARVGLTQPTPGNPVGLAPRATVGVLSPAHCTQLSALCPELAIIEIRRTSTQKARLRKGALDAILVPAHAINDSDRRTFDLIELGPELMLPPPCLGIIVILARTGSVFETMLQSLDNPESRSCLIAERMLAEALGNPQDLACLASVEVDGTITLRATLAGEGPDPRSALARVGAAAPNPPGAARSCRLALMECLGKSSKEGIGEFQPSVLPSAPGDT